MRRSKAPSALRKTKQDLESNNSLSHEEQYDWGSRRSKSENFNKNKRIFNVIWRDVSARKHKIWKGDGTLEVDNLNLKAILKDETGKWMGCSTKYDINRLVPDFQMVISSKEVEIQNEIRDEQELESLRKMQVEYLVNEKITFFKHKAEEEKKYKGGFTFKPNLLLKSPKLYSVEKTNLHLEGKTSNDQKEFSNLRDNDDDSESSLGSADHFSEFLCFFKPSELQQFLFQKVFKYISAMKSNEIEGLHIEHVLKQICNHPSFINHKLTTNKLLRHLIPFLPDWTEMGPFDSSKLEFVQHFLNDLTKSNQQTCIILTKNLNVSNMLQGLCDFMKIKCLRLYSNTLQNIESQVLNFCSPINGLSFIIIVNSLELLSCFKFSDFSKTILVFEEYFEITKYSSYKSFKDTTIYYLITAFSIEELLLLGTHNIKDLLNDLMIGSNNEYDGCYLHSKIECNCFKSNDDNLSTENAFVKNWKHYKTPFDIKLLKMHALENSSENIVSIFCKKN